MPVTRPADAARTPTRASVVDLTFALWALASPLLLHDRLVNGDGDLARHLVTGRHILSHGPRFDDPFSFTRAGEPFLAYEWLSQVLYALVHAVAGLPGVVLLASLVLAGAFALVVAYVRRGGDPWLAFLVGMLSAVLVSPHWIARPHLFTFLGLALLLHVAERRRWFWLVPLFAIWANLHPGFLYAWVMLAIWALGSWLDELGEGGGALARARPYLLALALAAGATLLNPFGWNLHVHALGLVGSDLAAAVEEFKPVDARTKYGLVVLSVMFLVVLGLAASRRWVGWRPLLMFASAFFAAHVAVRYAPLIGFFALPVMALALTPVVRELPAWAFGRMRAEFARSDAPGTRFSLVLVPLVLVVVVAGAILPRVRLLPDRFSNEFFPAAAVAEGRAAGAGERVLTEYIWGGFVLYAWPGHRVFVDSMADFYGHDLLKEYASMRETKPGWEESLDRWRISTVLFKPDAPIVEALRQKPGWRVVHEDAVAVLLVRAG